MKTLFTEGYSVMSVAEIHAMPALARFSPSYWGLAKELANLNPGRQVEAGEAAKPAVHKKGQTPITYRYIDTEAAKYEAWRLRGELMGKILIAAASGLKKGIGRLVEALKGQKTWGVR
ncbi:MAG: hypothetical protein OEW39_09365 [Deltaproteobacteria bacterium]|nr:hypothetical protein [Deltaproteobacteria bacterium]